MSGLKIQLLAIGIGAVVAAAPAVVAAHPGGHISGPAHFGPSGGGGHNHGMGAPNFNMPHQGGMNQHTPHQGATHPAGAAANNHPHLTNAAKDLSTAGKDLRSGHDRAAEWNMGAALRQSLMAGKNAKEAGNSTSANHPHLTSAAQDLEAARKAYRAGDDKLAERDLGKALQQALSAAKHAASVHGSAELTNHPPTTTPTSGTPGRSGSSGSQGGNGGGSHLQQALRDLSAARKAVRAGQDKQAQQDIRAALVQLEQAAQNHHHNNSHSGKSGKSNGGGTSGQQQQNGYIQTAAQDLNGALRKINDDQLGKAEIDIHHAFVQVTSAAQQEHQQR